MDFIGKAKWNFNERKVQCNELIISHVLWFINHNRKLHVELKWVAMSDMAEVEYVSNVFQNICGFKISQTISFTNATVLEIPSIQEAILLSTYAQLPFLIGKYEGIRFIELSSCKPIANKIYIQDNLSETNKEIPIFDLQSYLNMFYKLKQKFPAIFDGEKFLILATHRTDGASEKYIKRLYRDKITKLFEEIEKSGYNYEAFLLCEWHTDNKEFYVPENIFEYFVGVVLKNKGYMVTFPMGGGDVNAFKLSDLLKINNGKGIFLQELLYNSDLRSKLKSQLEGSLDKFSNPELKGKRLEIEESVIVEVESSPKRTLSYSGKSGFSQLAGYMVTGYFDKGFVAGPLALERHSDEKYGTISFDRKGDLFFIDFDGKRFNDDLNKIVVDLLKMLIRTNPREYFLKKSCGDLWYPISF
jgi:hypothetical protein